MDNIWRASIWSSLPFGREQGGCVWCRVGVALRVHQGLRCWTIALENLSLPALGHAAVVLGLQNIAMCILSVLATTAAVRARQSCSSRVQAPPGENAPP